MRFFTLKEPILNGLKSFGNAVIDYKNLLFAVMMSELIPFFLLRDYKVYLALLVRAQPL